MLVGFSVYSQGIRDPLMTVLCVDIAERNEHRRSYHFKQYLFVYTIVTVQQ